MGFSISYGSRIARVRYQRDSLVEARRLVRILLAGGAKSVSLIDPAGVELDVSDLGQQRIKKSA